MTSAVGGGEVGPQKANEREKNQLICDSDKGGGGKQSYMEALYDDKQNNYYKLFTFLVLVVNIHL